MLVVNVGPCVGALPSSALLDVIPPGTIELVKFAVPLNVDDADWEEESSEIAEELDILLATPASSEIKARCDELELNIVVEGVTPLIDPLVQFSVPLIVDGVD